MVGLYSIDDERYRQILDIALTLNERQRWRAWMLARSIWPDKDLDFDDFEFDINLRSNMADTVISQ